MVRLISQLKGSLRHQFVVLKLGSQARTQTKPTRQENAVAVPNLRALMELRVDVPANTEPRRTLNTVPNWQR